MKISINRGCNIHITFDNNVTVSIFIGGGSYSDNHDDFELIGHEREKDLSSWIAEIAAWKEKDKWITQELRPDANDDVLGWQTTEEILDFLNKAANYKEV